MLADHALHMTGLIELRARERARSQSRNTAFVEADVMQLPFDDAAFDVVVCQFGVMFFPDRAEAYAETRRVLT